ncbi:MAG: hypothetical protein LBG48_01630 [Rickettsiales bacterium]|jgi:hypothetical protein|nr:hypothetical protein [Rickettsiales bacterium]
MFKKIKEKILNKMAAKVSVLCLLLGLSYYFYLHSSRWLSPKNNTDGGITNYDLTKLEDELMSLRQKVEQNESKIDRLSLELTKLQNQEPTKNVNNVKILMTIFGIMDKINKNEDFIQEYEFLRILAEGKPSIYEYVFGVKNHLEYYLKNVEETYSKEYRLFTVEEATAKKNKIEQFFYNNITIRKISNFNNKDDKIDIVLHDLSISIKTRNYSKALEIIDDNNLTDNFKGTREALLQRKELRGVIEGILYIIYNEYY